MKKLLPILVTLSLLSCAKQNEFKEPQIDRAKLSLNAAALKSKFKLDHIKDDETPNSSMPYLPLPEIEPEFDALHYQLSLNFPAESLLKPFFDAEVKITLKPLKNSFQLLSLDSSGLQIKKVTLLNTLENLNFEQRQEVLLVDLNKAYGPEDTLVVAINYHWEKSPNRGVYFRSRTGASGVEAIYSQSEPELSKYWFPGNSHPNDRATFEAYIQVPKPFVALSNGALVKVTDNGSDRTFHWTQQIPMVSYLFVVTAGKFGLKEDLWNGTPVQYYGPQDDMERLSYSLRNTPDMITHFSQVTGFAYPYEKYAQAVVPQYMWGGMEHTTATTLTDRTVHSPKEEPDFSSDDLASHELAHQWFGDLITCKNWDHLWLNEGFATYFNALYQEHARGKLKYLKNLIDESAWYFEEEALSPRPVVFKYYQESPDYFFDSRAYAKGAYVLHMLRQLLGDEIFFKGIRHYVFRHQNTLVKTPDFEKAMEETSGQNLNWFFEQWLYRPGYPKFQVSWNYDSTSHQIAIDVAQTQDLTKPGGIIGTTPVFVGKMPIEIDGVRYRLDMKSAKEVFKLTLDKKPSYLKFNSENSWLAQVNSTQSMEAWQAQLEKSLDPLARMEAADELSHIKEPTTQATRINLILKCAQTDSASWVRTKCISTLANALSQASLQINEQALDVLLALTKESDWHIRASTFEALASFPAEKVLPSLRKALKDEMVLTPLVSVIKTIGALKSKESYDLLLSLMGRKSFQDRLQEAALRALENLKDLRALDIAQEYSQPCYGEQVRLGAFDLLVSLGLAFKDQASEPARISLESSLKEDSYRVRKNAVIALGKLKNKAAIPALTQVLETDPDDRVRKLAKEAIEEINKP